MELQLQKIHKIKNNNKKLNKQKLNKFKLTKIERKGKLNLYIHLHYIPFIHTNALFSICMYKYHSLSNKLYIFFK